MSELAGLAWNTLQKVAAQRDKLTEELAIVRARNEQLEAMLAEYRVGHVSPEPVGLFDQERM